ncbi:MAG: hypothetical protein ACLQK8_29375 [Streptosporangiaceae bacterium]
MQLPHVAHRRLIGAAAIACAATLIPAASFAATAAPASWKIVKTVLGNPSTSFDHVTATSPHSAWLFQSFGTTSHKPVAWRLSGSRWTPGPFPGTAGESVTSAASTSPDDVWAVAYNGVAGSGARSQVLSWNGTSWAVTGSFPGLGGEVVSLSLRDAWFFDSGQPGGGAWHYNGHRWSRTPNSNALADGSALSPHSIWAIGATRVAHWNGHAWSRTSVKGLLVGCPREPDLCGPHLSGIYAQSPDSVWATGTGERETIGGPVAVLHFNGHHWTRVAVCDSCDDPVSVSPDGTGGLWIPIRGFEFRASVMLHYARGHLTFAALPAVKGSVLHLAAAAAVPGTRRAITVGNTIPTTEPIGLHSNAVILAYGS